MLATDICIVSFPRDYEWLSYCLRSIRKFATGYRRIILALPHNAPRPDFDVSDCFVIDDVPLKTGYIAQAVTKMRIYRESDAEFFAILDSDHVCNQIVDFAEYFEGTKPVMYRRPWESVPLEWRIWKPVTRRLIGHSEWFTLESLPLVYHRSTLSECCECIEKRHKRSLEDYANPLVRFEFTEFVALGNYAIENQPDQYVFRQGPNPDPKFLWHWSYSGVTPELRAKFEGILA